MMTSGWHPPAIRTLQSAHRARYHPQAAPTSTRGMGTSASRAIRRIHQPPFMFSFMTHIGADGDVETDLRHVDRIRRVLDLVDDANDSYEVCLLFCASKLFIFQFTVDYGIG